MKARSVVFTHIQWPFAIFGLPPKMMAICMTAGMVVYVLTVLFGAIAISMIAFAVTMAAGLSWVYRLARRDRHVESVTLTTVGFWRFRPFRWLLAGAPSSKGGHK